MKKISAKKKADISRQHKVRARLLLVCPHDNRGFPLCPQCGRLPDLKDGRGKLHMHHEKSLAQGGRTSYANCYLACRRCHNGEDGHRTEDVPHGKAVDKVPMLSGFSHGHAYSKEMQTRIKSKEVS